MLVVNFSSRVVEMIFIALTTTIHIYLGTYLKNLKSEFPFHFKNTTGKILYDLSEFVAQLMKPSSPGLCWTPRVPATASTLLLFNISLYRFLCTVSILCLTLSTRPPHIPLAHEVGQNLEKGQPLKKYYLLQCHILVIYLCTSS